MKAQTLHAGVGVTSGFFLLSLFCPALAAQDKQAPPDPTRSQADTATLDSPSSPAEAPRYSVWSDKIYEQGGELYQTEHFTQAADAYRRACDEGSAKACTNLGFMYKNGQGVPRDFQRAGRLYRQGCDGGNALGCTNLGIMYWNNSLPKDDTVAADLFLRGCDGGDSRGCREIAFMYERGQGVQRDLRRAADFYAQAAEEAREHHLSFRVRDGMILIEPNIGGEEVTLVVDTGATRTTLSLRFLPSMLKSTAPTETVAMAQGSVPVYATSVVWNLDGQDRHLPALIGDLQFPDGAQGVLGADILETFRSVRFDFLNSVIVLEDR